MSKKLVKYGRDLALVIDEPILESLHIDAKTSLEVVIKQGSIIITPSEGGQQAKSANGKTTKEIAERLMEKYHKTFEKLSKN
jgi:hypothetical protein